MSALNKAVTKKASKRRAEQRRDREAPYTLAPPDTARAVAKALPALRKTDIIVGLNALTRRLERDGVRWCALCDEAEPRALLDGVVELARRRDVPMLALPPGSGKAVAAALRVKRCLAFGLAVEAADADDDAARRTALEDLAALAFAQRSAPTERAAAKRARHRGAFDVFSSSEACSCCKDTFCGWQKPAPVFESSSCGEKSTGVARLVERLPRSSVSLCRTAAAPPLLTSHPQLFPSQNCPNNLPGASP